MSRWPIKRVRWGWWTSCSPTICVIIGMAYTFLTLIVAIADFSNIKRLLKKSRNQKTKFFGVIIDEKVTWQEHINYISVKVSKGIGIITKARKVLHKQSLVNLYYSFIYTYLIFFNLAWVNACKSHMHRILLSQKENIVRIIVGVQPRCHTDPMFSQMKLLKPIKFMNILLVVPLRWRHNGRPGVSNHWPHDCLLNRLYSRRSKKTWKLRVTGLCVRKSPAPHKWPVTRKMFPFDDVIVHCSKFTMGI